MALMSVTDKQRRLGLQPGPASSSNSSSTGQLMMTADRNDLVIDGRERLDLWLNRFNVTRQTSYSSASNFQMLLISYFCVLQSGLLPRNIKICRLFAGFTQHVTFLGLNVEFLLVCCYKIY